MLLPRNEKKREEKKIGVALFFLFPPTLGPMM
jgi:hypothetical protein